MIGGSSVLALATTDCEANSGGFIGQPVNTLTSFAYVFTGAALIVRGVRRQSRARRADFVYGTLLVGVGLGSMAFHGPQPRGSQALHDAPILAALYFILVHNLADVGRIQHGESTFLAGVIPVAVVASAPAVGPAASGALAIAVVASEVVAYRSEQRSRAGSKVIVGLMVVAGVAYLLGRTGSPLCHPDSPVQLHGLWHLLSAAALGGWGWMSPHSDSEPLEGRPTWRR
ncbi:MAG: ceramidase domain-containing protein [Acidimicrobiia bacterium]